MLYKSELKKIPPCAKPKVDKEALRDKTHVAGVVICEVPRCGKVLTIDYYSLSNRKLQVRFFSDGNSYISYDCNSGEWFQKYITPVLESNSKELFSNPVFTDEESLDQAAEFLGQSPDVWFYSMYTGYRSHSSQGIVAVVDRFIQDKKEKERERAIEKQEADFTERKLWFPDFDKKVDSFCNNKAFEENYIFFTSFDKKHKRKYTCSRCGKTWSDSDTPKHKSSTQCPHCHAKALFWAERYQTCIKDETTICTAQKYNKQLGLRWAKVTRTFLEKKPRLHYTTNAYTFYLNVKGKPKIVSYFYSQAPYYYGYCWTKPRNGEICSHKAFVYSDNLTEVFGEKYYNVNLKTVLDNCNKPINFIRLLDNLKDIPQCEYMCKLGLTSLASELVAADYENGETFGQILGVSKQYVPMYKRLNIDASEHRVIRASRKYVSEDMFRKFSDLKIFKSDYHRVERIIQHMTLETFCRYVKKQAEVCSTDTSRIVVWLSDYYDLCTTLDVPINKQTVRPRNIKLSHDRLTEQYNKVKADLKDEASRKALEFVNGWFNGYDKDGLCIKVPKYKSDFIKEGQALNHCVGSPRYYDNHIKGTKMIFFIRKSEKPDEPYYTSEIDMTMFKVCQCYGYGDKSAPKKIISFINEFARWMRKRISTKEVLKHESQEDICPKARCA
ncbi:MAG: PcfJ domain-containing protein [Ruminococcus sp.]|nr:PcfJ domain-containing protein [Ruminococcus sp.]